MLAKAMAKESGATFINIGVSALANKWYGESNQLVAGLFGLARKLQPSIIFMDEIDSFLRERGKGDHEATSQLKAEFMSLWDGLLSANDRILVLGATNRPEDIDEAMMRRMPKRYAVGLPNAAQRQKILTLVSWCFGDHRYQRQLMFRQMLKDTPLDAHFPIPILAAQTDGYSGSDLREACRNAAMVPVRQYLQAHGMDPSTMEKDQQAVSTLEPPVVSSSNAPAGVQITTTDSSRLPFCGPHNAQLRDLPRCSRLIGSTRWCGLIAC